VDITYPRRPIETGPVSWRIPTHSPLQDRWIRDIHSRPPTPYSYCGENTQRPVTQTKHRRSRISHVHRPGRPAGRFRQGNHGLDQAAEMRDYVLYRSKYPPPGNSAPEKPRWSVDIGNPLYSRFCWRAEVAVTVHAMSALGLSDTDTPSAPLLSGTSALGVPQEIRSSARKNAPRTPQRADPRNMVHAPTFEQLIEGLLKKTLLVNDLRWHAVQRKSRQRQWLWRKSLCRVAVHPAR